MNAAEMIRAIEAVQARNPQQRGDQSEPCDGRDEERLSDRDSDRDSDWAAAVWEDSVKRWWP